MIVDSAQVIVYFRSHSVMLLLWTLLIAAAGAVMLFLLTHSSVPTRSDTVGLHWKRFARKARRLAFKRREWGLLGGHLATIKERGRA